ncbi:MAG: hypothetical protein HYT62_01415 [Candidatus Yanofskybacteria bacterium]|nr:hypothetical protein [Candidatus Yanofskybacteria bacterium]
MLNTEGIELLGIVDNFYLIHDGMDIEDKIDSIVRAYPYIKYLQIGNEYTTIVFDEDPTLRGDYRITVEYYMRVFNRIYNHVAKNYPDITLLTYSILGSGERGPQELERMAKLGLKDMSRQRVIVAINCYSAGEASWYPGVLSHSLRGYRVWVTESGNINPSQHIDHIKYEYPAIKNILRAERIYWYVLWEVSGFKLIDDFPDSQSPARWSSPLFKALINGGQ